MTPEAADRLAERRIELLAETKSHFLFGRVTCIALVERNGSGFGSIGSTGVMTESGLAYLVQHEQGARLAGKGGASEASAGQIDAIRRFSEDLKTALGR